MNRAFSTLIAITFCLFVSLANASWFTYFMGTPAPAPGLNDPIEPVRYPVHDKLEQVADGARETVFTSDLSAWHKSVLTRAGAIKNESVRAVVTSAWAKKPLMNDDQVEHLGDAYQMLKKEGVISSELLWDGYRAIEFGHQFNEGIARARLNRDGLAWNHINSLGRFSSHMAVWGWLPAHTRPLLDTMAYNDGRLIPYNTVLGYEYYQPEVTSLTDFISESKTEERLNEELNKPEAMAQIFQKIAGGQFLKLQKVPETALIGKQKSAAVADTIIAAALDYAAEVKNTVYFLSFKGEKKHQLFAISIDKHGYLNIAFAMDSHRPVPVAVITIPGNELDVQTITESIETLMNSRRDSDRVPELVGIWRVAKE